MLREAARDAGIEEARQPHGRNLGAVTNAQLRELVEGAGFGRYDGATRTIVDEVPDAQDLLDWNRSRSFGNSLAEFEGAERQRLIDALAARLEPYRRDGAIRLERYLIFATAVKPAAH